MLNYTNSAGLSSCRQATTRVQEETEEATVVGITFQTLQRIMAQKKPDELLALYCFYAKTAAKQGTQSIWATVEFVSKGLGWREEKVRKVKKRLMELGLVEEKEQKRKAGGKFEKSYMIVRFLKSPGLPETVPPQNGETGNGGVKCLGRKDAVEGKKCLRTKTQAGARVEVPFENQNQERIAEIYREVLSDYHGHFLPVTTVTPEFRKACFMASEWSNSRIRDCFLQVRKLLPACEQTVVRILWSFYETDMDFKVELSDDDFGIPDDSDF